MSSSIPRVAPAATAIALSLTLSVFAVTSAQVASLSDPDENAEATAAPVSEELEGEEALLAFAQCMRENDIDMDDPQFGVAGGRFGGGGPGGEGPGFDIQSSEFQDAMDACGNILEALRPDLDPEEEAERTEERLEMAECMRGLGWDFPDPDPNGGFGPRMMESGLDFSDPAFGEDITTCQTDLGIEGPGGPTGGPPA